MKILNVILLACIGSVVAGCASSPEVDYIVEDFKVDGDKVFFDGKWVTHDDLVLIEFTKIRDVDLWRSTAPKEMRRIFPRFMSTNSYIVPPDEIRTFKSTNSYIVPPDEYKATFQWRQSVKDKNCGNLKATNKIYKYASDPMTVTIPAKGGHSYNVTAKYEPGESIMDMPELLCWGLVTAPGVWSAEVWDITDPSNKILIDKVEKKQLYPFKDPYMGIFVE